VVTGGASGIGLATVRRLHAAGARVVVADISDGRDVAEELDGVFVRTDVADEGQVADLMHAATARFGSVDILVNNAGIGLGDGMISDQAYDDYRRQFDVNVMGVVYGIKHVADHMPDGGAIVNTASMAGVLGLPGGASYAASKWSVIGITKTAALELAPRAIRVNAICPSSVSTPMTANVEEVIVGRAVVDVLQPVNRMATAAEIAAGIHFLVADDCGLITGHALHVDGGLVAGPSLRSIEIAIDQYRADAEQHEDVNHE
jgi:NAD(P)-dependent dehydrogenase (short-subunit alcohol dehydrogenase family)